MNVALVTRAVPVRLVATLALGAAFVLAAGVAGVTQPLVAVAVAVAAAATVPGIALICLGFAIRVTVRAGGACRCVGMLGFGVLSGGLTAGALPLVGPDGRQPVAAAGLALAGTLFVLGMLQIPGAVATSRARLRLVLDGISIGLLLALTGWLLVPGLSRLAYTATVLAVTCAVIVGGTVLCAARQRPVVVRCAAGSLLAVTGLALVAATAGPGTPPWTLLAAAALVVAGPPVIWAGARAIESPSPRQPACPGERLGGYQLLALPVAAAGFAAVYHLITAGPPDHIGMALSIACGAALAVRTVVAGAELRQRAGQAADRERFLHNLLSGPGDGTAVLDGALVVRWVAPGGPELLPPVGRRFPDLVHPEEAATVAGRLAAVLAGTEPSPALLPARMRDGAGGWQETESTVTDLRHLPAVGGLVVQLREVGQRRHLERTARLLARADPGTGLPDRQVIRQVLTARGSRGRPRGVLLVLEVEVLTAGPGPGRRDRATGTAVLREVARRLRTHTGPEDLVARLGGSQFGVLPAGSPIEAYALAVRLVGALAAPPPAAGPQAPLSASAGLAAVGPADHADEVLHRATLALRRARERGPEQVEWFDESMQEQLVRRLDVERHLPGAVRRGELDLAYQPVVDLAGDAPATLRPVGVEALLRWQHPVLGRVPPVELVPVADQLRLSGEIGDWVLHTACRQVARWRREGHDLWLAVNVSAGQLTGTGFVAGLAAALSVHQTPPERLTVEIAASEASLALPAVASQLSKVRGLGVRTALDGLGAGDIELEWLRRLPLDLLKLTTPPVSGSAAEVAAAAVGLAQRLGLVVVAKGLETAAQWGQVRDAGCQYGQGYLVGPPATAERVEAFLVAGRAATG